MGISGSLNGNTFSGKQWQVFGACDSGVGTFNTSTNFSDGRRFDIEGITFPSWNPVQEFEMRTSATRIAEFDSVFSTSKRVMTEFTLTGRLTQEVWVMLLENVLAKEITGGTDNSVITLDSSYSPSNMENGLAVTSASDWSKTMSFYFKAPTNADSYQLKGCVCTNLNVSADMDTAAGRFNYSATFQTQYQATKGATNTDNASTIGANNIFLSNLTYKQLDIKNWDGSTDTDDIKPLFSNFNITVDCPAVFLGSQGTNGEPEVIGRALPELAVTYGGSVKYDTETDNMVEAFRDTGGSSYLGIYVADVDNVGTTEEPDNDFFGTPSTSKFGFWAGKSKLTSCEVSSDDVALINFEAKMLAPSSGNYAHFLAGDNA